MVTVKLYRIHDGMIKGFQVKGHADMAEHGQDIACAAVSVLTQTAVLGLCRYLELQPEVKRKRGYLECMISQPDQKTEKVQAIFETMAIGLKEIAGQFPDYVRMEEHRR